MNATQLTLLEVQRLEVLESVIDAGMQTFVHVGNALLEIRDNKLHRGTHHNFDDYCRDRWGFTGEYARLTMRATEAVANLRETQTIVGVLPATESQVRPLTVLQPDAQREVWRRAVETAPNGKVTAAHVQTVVNEYRGDGETIKVPHVANNSGNNEWYTPAEYIEAARRVLGCIDLDPASSALANEVVGATLYYAAMDDGLAQEWAGRVWMNPPYAADLIGKFCGKFAAHKRTGEIDAGIVLVNNATETEWFSSLISACSAVVFPRSRVKFWQPNGAIGAPLQGQAILYAGGDADLFLDVFGRFGWGAYV